MFCKLAFVCKVHLKYIKPLLTPAVPYLGPAQVGVWKQKDHQMKKMTPFMKALEQKAGLLWVGTSRPKPISRRRGWWARRSWWGAWPGWPTGSSPLGFCALPTKDWRAGGGKPQVMILFLDLLQCYLSLGHVKVAHPVFTGPLHPRGWRNGRPRLPPDSAGPRHR